LNGSAFHDRAIADRKRQLNSYEADRDGAQRSEPTQAD